MIEIKDRDEEEKNTVDEAVTGLMGKYAGFVPCRECVYMKQEETAAWARHCLSASGLPFLLQEGEGCTRGKRREAEAPEEKTGYREHIMGRFMEVG